MKILLVRPGYANLFSKVNIVNVEPLELEYLYTVAKEQGAECEIFDAVIQKKKLTQVLKSYNPDIVAITGYITQRNIILNYAKAIKMHNPGVTVVIGGVHAELNYNEFYSDEVDYIVHSGGVKPFAGIINLHKNSASPEEIPGICYRKQSIWICNAREILDPNKLPIPDRTYFYNNQDHFKYLNLTPCATVKAAYSCPHKCNFCYCCQLNEGKYVCRDVEKVVEEIASIQCDNIWILDDTFYVDREKIKDFVRLLKEKGISKNLILYYRADFVAENEDMIALLSSIGLKILLVGLEAFDDSRLKDYDKRTSVVINERCLQILRKYNIECTGLFIVDMDATREDFVSLSKYVQKHELKISTAAILTPLPGTYQFEKYRSRFTTDNPQDWDFLHLTAEPGNLSRSQFYFEFYKFYLKILLMNKKAGNFEVNYIQHVLNLAKAYTKKMLQMK